MCESQKDVPYPYAHFDDNPKTALSEDSVIVRTKSVIEKLPAAIAGLLIWSEALFMTRMFVGHGTHAGSNEFTIGENHLEAAVHHPVIYGRSTISLPWYQSFILTSIWCITNPSFNSIADD
jgi:hypothetical protein